MATVSLFVELVFSATIDIRADHMIDPSVHIQIIADGLGGWGLQSTELSVVNLCHCLSTLGCVELGILHIQC